VLGGHADSLRATELARAMDGRSAHGRSGAPNLRGGERVKGGANSVSFHASRRACGFYSWYRLRPAWWSPHKSDDMGARARTVRVRPSWSVWSGLVAPPPTQRPVILILIAHCYMAVTRGPPLHPPSYSTQARTRGVRVVQTQRRHEYTALGTDTYYAR
jgi:hypothetical protein